MRRGSSKLGRWGEDLVAKYLGLKRVRFSGADWPHKEDVGGFLARPSAPTVKILGQVKTTVTDDQTGFLKSWLALAKNARAETAEPIWLEVYKTDWEAYIFEKRLVRVVRLGVGGKEV